MLSVPVFSMNGEARGQLEIDPALLGGEVRPQLLKQAIVTWLDHQRQESARRKSRGEIAGSTKKLYRQKGTGNARVGPIRTPQRRGGGRAFPKRGPRSSKDFPKKMRRLARDNALLAKIQAGELLVIEGLSCPEPKTRTIAAMLGALKIENGCLLATDQYDRNIVLSGRNLERTEVRVFEETSAYEILRRRRVVVARPAFERLAAGKARPQG